MPTDSGCALHNGTASKGAPLTAKTAEIHMCMEIIFLQMASQGALTEL